MTQLQPMALTLWGQGFDEIAAATFVGDLRRFGVRVKTVGLNMQQTMGRNGLALRPDITLDQALPLAQSISCVIIPGTIAHLQQFGYDPRLAELLQRAAATPAIIVIGDMHLDPDVSRRTLHTPIRDVLVYSDEQTLSQFVHGVLIPRLELRSAPS